METYVKPPSTGIEAFEMMPEGTLCQLINDVLIMSPAPNTLHARVQNRIFVQLYNYIAKVSAGEVFCAPIDVFLNDNNVFQPDILFISKDRINIISNKGIEGAPDLVIEILSKRNEKYDLNDKKSVYEQSGVKEYWVINPETKTAEGFVLKDGHFLSIGKRNGSINFGLISLSISF